jgi:hypothetical protein
LRARAPDRGDGGGAAAEPDRDARRGTECRKLSAGTAAVAGFAVGETASRRVPSCWPCERLAEPAASVLPHSRAAGAGAGARARAGARTRTRNRAGAGAWAAPRDAGVCGRVASLCRAQARRGEAPEEGGGEEERRRRGRRRRGREHDDCRHENSSTRPNESWRRGGFSRRRP